MISSFPTFIPRPTALRGLAFIRTASIRSGSPQYQSTVQGPTYSLAGAEALVAQIEDITQRMQLEDSSKPLGVSCDVPSWGSHHFPFFAHSVPMIGIGTESLYPEDRLYVHSRADTPNSQPKTPNAHDQTRLLSQETQPSL